MSGERFLQVLTMAARLTRTDLTPDIFAFYRERLEPFGLDRACAAISLLCENPKSMPSVAEIKQALGVAVIDPKARGTAIAHEIWRMLSRGVQADTAERASPEANALVRRLGGWRLLSDETSSDDKATLIAQWRDAAAGMLPSFDREQLEGETHPKVLALIAKAKGELTEK